mgnify:CR=1 FL=1
MSYPQIEFVRPGGHQLYQLDHRSLHERRAVPMREVDGEEARSGYLGGLGRVHMALADAAEREGFRIATGKADDLIREMSRTAAVNGAMNKAMADALALDGTAAHAALADAGKLADVYGRIQRNAQRALIEPCARHMAQTLREQYGRQVVADSLALACSEGIVRNGRRRTIKIADRAALADADLNLAGGLVENLTQYLFMAFKEPQAPRHWREVFRVQGGINIGLLFLQVLFYTIRGEAKVWEGTSGDYGNSGPGAGQLKLPVIHLRSSDNLDIITAARELLVFGAANMRTQQLRDAHDLVVNRATFGMDLASPEQLPTLSLRNWPGVTAKTAPGTLAGMTSEELFEQLQAIIQEPKEISNQAFEADTIAMDVALQTASQKPMVLGGTPVGVSVWEYFRQQFPNVERKIMWELKDLYGSGLSTAFGYPAGTDAAPVALYNEPQMLPQYTYGFGVRSDMYSTYAGIVWPAPVGAEIRNFDRE